MKKQYLYNGQLVTANSKREAIQVIAKEDNKEFNELVKVMKKYGMFKGFEKFEYNRECYLTFMIDEGQESDFNKFCIDKFGCTF